VVDPLNGEPFIHVADTLENEMAEFVDSLNTCTKSGLHNPLKNPERYIEYGSIAARAASKMREPKVMEFFAKLIQRVAPKSHAQVNTQRNEMLFSVVAIRDTK
jgi:1-pyrroline-5-carboxylate dehydrogenase